MTTPNYEDLKYNKPTKDGKYDAILLKYFVKEAEETKEVYHTLGRIPRKVDIVWSDNPIERPQVDYLDTQKAILVFFESDTNIILRFE